MGFNGLTVLAAPVIVIAVIVIEVVLSRKQNKWLGLIPIAAVVIIWLAVFAWYEYSLDSYTVKTLERDISGGNTMQLNVRYDRNNEVVDFGMLDIKSASGETLERLALYFTKNGKLENDVAVKPYREEINELLKGIELTGFSIDDEDMKGASVNGSGNTTIRFTGGIKSLLLVILTTTSPLMAIYVIVRLTMRAQRRKAELKKVDVENLK